MTKNTKTNRITLKAIDEGIATFVQSRDALRNHAQSLILMIALHACPSAVDEEANGTGDVSRYIKLGRALPTSWATQAMSYLKDYTPVRLVLRDTGDSVGLSPEYRKLSEERKNATPERKAEIDAERNAMWDIAGMRTVPFFEHEAEAAPTPPKEFDDLLKASTTGRAKALRKMVEDGKVLPKDIPSVEALATMLETVTVGRVTTDAPKNDDDEEQPKEKAAKRAA